jgi:hypothetical protein
MKATSTPTPYLKWAQNYAAGVQAAEAKTARTRTAAQSKAVAHRAEGAKRPCGIKGCTRHAFKGRMCRLHYGMVPASSKIAVMIECMTAQRRIADKHHRRMLRELRRSLAGGFA